MDLVNILLAAFGVLAMALSALYVAKRSGAKDVIDILTQKVDLLEESLAKRDEEVAELRLKVATLTGLVRGDEILNRLERKIDEISRVVRNEGVAHTHDGG